MVSQVACFWMLWLIAITKSFGEVMNDIDTYYNFESIVPRGIHRLGWLGLIDFFNLKQSNDGRLD